MWSRMKFEKKFSVTIPWPKIVNKRNKLKGYIHTIFKKITDQNWFFLSRTIGILIIEKSQHMHFTFLQFFLLLWQAKEPWENTPEEKMSLAKHHKDKGTDCFKVAFHFPVHFVNVDTPRFLQCSLSSLPDCCEVLLKSKSHLSYSNHQICSYFSYSNPGTGTWPKCMSCVASVCCLSAALCSKLQFVWYEPSQYSCMWTYVNLGENAGGV